MSTKDLSSITFGTHFINSLCADSEQENFVRRVSNIHYSLVNPTAVANPRLLSYSKNLAALLGIDFSNQLSATEILSGNKLNHTTKPYAMRYGGHQFGSWAAQLGDGRAINLGNLLGLDGKQYELQLKGSGPTPYSRRADGRAVLRSSIREYLCSEAMFYLGIPTTRALSLVGSGDLVTRDMFYDGNSRKEPGAIVCRVAESFLRFGNFEILAFHQEQERLTELVQFTIKNYFPELLKKGKNIFDQEIYRSWFEEICRRTGILIAKWMSVGFVHAVMNTDNMSILGLTIDYGPYGWLDAFDNNWTPNTSDESNKRDRFSAQPNIGLWNLEKLADALSLFLPQDDMANRG